MRNNFTHGYAFIFFIFSAVFAQAQDVIHCQLKPKTQPHTYSVSCEGQPSHFSVVIQTGNYAGFISPGLSYQFFRKNQFVLLGGYVPHKIDGSQLWQLSFKYQLAPFDDVVITLKNGKKISFDPFHFGGTIIYGIHKNIFLQQPSQYPNNYYIPSALRYTFNVGTSVKFQRVTLYIDYSALDTSVFSYVRPGSFQFYSQNYPALGLGAIGTLGFGVKVNLVKKKKVRHE